MDISKIQINNVNYNLKDASAIASGTYDSSSQKIVFKNKDNVVICQIDATPFIVDGMVSNVAVSNGNLVITFNTDAGKSPISIPLTDIFNPSEYYTKIGYFVCDTAANTAAKTINATGSVLSTGGSIKIKMTNDNTANNATLNINSTGAKPLYYAGLRASSTNTWESGETIEVYYDGTNYMANNVAGGGSDGIFDVSAKTGDTYESLSAALTAMNALPSAYKKGGMSIKYVQTSDNKYRQFMFVLSEFTNAQFIDTSNWQEGSDVGGFSKIVQAISASTIYSKINIILNSGDKYRLSIISDGIVTQDNAVLVKYIFKDGTINTNGDVASGGGLTIPYNTEITCTENNVVAISIERDSSKVIANGNITFTAFRNDAFNIQNKPVAGSSALINGDGVLQTIRLRKIGSTGTTVFSVGDYYVSAMDAANLILVTAVNGSGTPTSWTLHPLSESKIYLCDGLNYEYKQGVGLSIIGKSEYNNLPIENFGTKTGKYQYNGVAVDVKTNYFYDKLGLRNGYYYNNSWVESNVRISSKLINCLNVSVPIITKNDILISGVSRFNQNFEYVDYVVISGTSYVLQPGYYYSIVFFKVGDDLITPNDVYGNIYIDKEIQLSDVEPDIYYSLTDATPNVWWQHNNDGTLSKSTVSNVYSMLLTDIEEGGLIEVTLKGGGGGRAWYFLDGDDLEPSDPSNAPHIVSVGGEPQMAPSGFNDTAVLKVPVGAESLLVQTNNYVYWGVRKLGSFNTLDQNVKELESDVTELQGEILRLDGNIDSSFLAHTPFLWQKIQRMIVKDSGFVNIGFIGDSWTQGTENKIDGVQQKNKYNSNDFQGYIRPLSKLLFDKYGFGGLGWLDFARDHGNGDMFGCSNLYSNWQYEFSRTGITGLDGSDRGSIASQCLGICCAHTIFANGAYLSLTFDTGYLDRFFIRYYKNAHFTVSINGGAAVEVTANSSDAWQETEFGVAGTDITSVLITSLADDSIIFGMDCFYGTKGIRCHKVGNRSVTAAQYLAMNAAQWEEGIKKLNLCWASVMLAINDLGSSAADENVMNQIVTRIGNLIGRIQDACTVSGLVTCDINLLGIYDIEKSTWTGLPALCGKQKKYALDNNYGWADTADVIGREKAQYTYAGCFSDEIHLNAIGTQALAEHIFKNLFTF